MQRVSRHVGYAPCPVLTEVSSWKYLENGVSRIMLNLQDGLDRASVGAFPILAWFRYADVRVVD